jgi:hypothetical protein
MVLGGLLHIWEAFTFEAFKIPIAPKLKPLSSSFV